jgi:hypothetical protein
MIAAVRLIFVLILLVSWPCFACEPALGASSRIATNVELVQDADLIILGRVTGGPPPEAKIGVPWADKPQIIVQPIEVLKGASPQTPVRLFGSLYDWHGKRVLPAPTPLSQAHPNVYEGGCVRTQFSKGTLVVAMFKMTPSGLRQLSFPLARNVEDVADPKATWVRAVKLYVAAMATNPQVQKHNFSELRAKLGHGGGAADLEIANDIGAYLRLHLGTKRTASKPWGAPWATPA